MDLIQLQYKDEDGTHRGGLYLNVDQIVAVRNDGGHCRIMTSPGVEYLVTNQLSSVLDEIVKINLRRIQEGRRSCQK